MWQNVLGEKQKWTSGRTAFLWTADFINERKATFLVKKLSSQFQVTYAFLDADRLIIH